MSKEKCLIYDYCQVKVDYKCKGDKDVTCQEYTINYGFYYKLFTEEIQNLEGELQVKSGDI